MKQNQNPMYQIGAQDIMFHKCDDGVAYVDGKAMYVGKKRSYILFTTTIKKLIENPSEINPTNLSMVLGVSPSRVTQLMGKDFAWRLEDIKAMYAGMGGFVKKVPNSALVAKMEVLINSLEKGYYDSEVM